MTSEAYGGRPVPSLEEASREANRKSSCLSATNLRATGPVPNTAALDFVGNPCCAQLKRRSTGRFLHGVAFYGSG